MNILIALEALGLALAILDGLSLVSILIYLLIAVLWQLSHDPMFLEIEESEDKNIDEFMRETVITDVLFRFLCYPIVFTLVIVTRPIRLFRKRQRP